MSVKVRDKHRRWRNVDVNFRVSPEENALINRMVALSGLTKRAYLAQRAMQQDVVVFGNPKVHKALQAQMEQLYLEFKRICDASEVSPETLEVLRFLATIYDGMKASGKE